MTDTTNDTNHHHVSRLESWAGSLVRDLTSMADMLDDQAKAEHARAWNYAEVGSEMLAGVCMESADARWKFARSIRKTIAAHQFGPDGVLK